MCFLDLEALQGKNVIYKATSGILQIWECIVFKLRLLLILTIVKDDSLEIGLQILLRAGLLSSLGMNYYFCSFIWYVLTLAVWCFSLVAWKMTNERKHLFHTSVLVRADLSLTCTKYVLFFFFTFISCGPTCQRVTSEWCFMLCLCRSLWCLRRSCMASLHGV